MVFDNRRVSRPERARVEFLSDEAATAILLGEIGITNLTEGDVNRAARQLEIALGLDPELAWAWSGLGEARRSQGENELAMDAYQKALEVASVRQ